jgi:hypothetical protein
LAMIDCVRSAAVIIWSDSAKVATRISITLLLLPL